LVCGERRDRGYWCCCWLFRRLVSVFSKHMPGRAVPSASERLAWPRCGLSGNG